MALQIRKFSTPEALASAAARDWLELVKKNALKPGTPTEAVLSGGRITKQFFGELVRLTYGKESDFPDLLTACELHFFWADERCVPPDDPEGNYNIARQLLFEPLKIPAERIHRIRGEADLADAVKDATDAVRTQFKGKMQKAFDTVILGVGEDGHIASLFPGETEEVMNDPSVYRAVTAVKPPPRRITLGYSAIANAADVWVLASGPGKEAALAASLSGGKTPLGRLLKLRSTQRIVIYTDIPVPQGASVQ